MVHHRVCHGDASMQGLDVSGKGIVAEVIRVELGMESGMVRLGLAFDLSEYVEKMIGCFE